MHQAKVNEYARQGRSASMPGHRLTRYSPVISGLLLYHFRARTHEMGLAVANAWGSITYALHLYVALEQEKLLATSNNGVGFWQDMYIIMRLLGGSSFFVGAEVPGTIEGYFNKFSLQMGTTASILTKNTRRRPMTQSSMHSRAGPRGIKDGLAVYSMFIDRYVYNTGQIDWTPEHVDDVVSRSLILEELSEEIGAPDGNGQPRGKKSKKTADGSHLPPDLLVKALALALEEETVELVFPYLTLHRSAWDVLRAVHAACNPLLIELYSAAYMEKETQLPWTVGWIFRAAHLDGDMRPMEQAAAAVKTW